MRTFSAAFIVILALGLGGCWATTPNSETGKNPIQTGGETLTNVVAPALPGPIGGVVAGVGTLMALVGGLFAGKVKQAAIAEGGPSAASELNPLTKIFAERKWLFPVIAAFLTGGTGANLWHIDPSVLALLDGALLTPALGEFVKDSMAKPAIAASIEPPPPPTPTA
jgi:hypothetical protein